jgi:hypothetical protein
VADSVELHKGYLIIFKEKEKVLLSKFDFQWCFIIVIDWEERLLQYQFIICKLITVYETQYVSLDFFLSITLMA